MSKTRKEKLIEVLLMVAEDAEKDTNDFDGQPFTGKTVGTYMGYHAASIKTLAGIVKELLEDPKILLK